MVKYDKLAAYPSDIHFRYEIYIHISSVINAELISIPQKQKLIQKDQDQLFDGVFFDIQILPKSFTFESRFVIFDCNA